MTVLRWLFDTSIYAHAYDRQRAYLLYGILGVMVVLYGLYGAFIPEWGDDLTLTQWQFAQVDVLGTLYVTWFFGGALASYLLIRQGYLGIASWGPVLMWIMPAMVTTVLNPAIDFDTPTVTASIIVLVLLAGVLVGETGTIGSSLLAVGVMLLFSDNAILPSVLTVTLLTIGSAALMIMFNRLLQVNRREGETTVAQERLKLAELNSIITRKASQRAPLQEVLELAVGAITERYGTVYHAQIFLITDDGVQARLTASTGEAGRILLERQHSLAVGSLSVIGQTTLKGKPTVEYSGVDSVHQRNELLPDTAVEAAFPLRVGADIIGALDLQSKQRNAFNDDDVAQFQSLADSLSLIIDNVRQFEAAQNQVHENQRLADQARAALEEVKRLNKRLIGRAWSEYLRTQTRTGGLNVDFEANTIEEDGRWTATLAQAAQEDNFVQAGRVIAVPLRVRGQVIGAMEFELSDDGALSAEDREVIAEISERFGLAAENSRLVEESQRSARREALINQISARLQANNTIEATLTEAARSLSDTLQAGRIAIRLGTPASDGSIRNTVPGNNGHANGRKGES